MSLTIIYDDTAIVPDEVMALAGVQSFGNVIFRRKSLLLHIQELAEEADLGAVQVVNRNSPATRLLDNLAETNGSSRFLVFPSHVVAMSPRSAVITLLRKLRYAQNNMFLTVRRGLEWAGLALLDSKMLRRLVSGTGLPNIKDFIDDHKDDFFEMDNQIGFVDLREVGQFLGFLTSNFDVRHFNSITNDAYTITKRSTDRGKLKREFTYFSLLPPSLQMFFVQPFNFEDNGQTAAYTMERLLVPDMAIQWVHGAISMTDFEKFLDRIFHFIALRPARRVQRSDGLTEADRLYRAKVIERVDKLKSTQQFTLLQPLADHSVGGIDRLLDRYLALYDKLRAGFDGRELRIGHGDLCFSNILYSKTTQILRFIDPRGAVTEDELYTDPYYDIAKLSHSIVGGYDFVNSGQFELIFDSDLRLRLSSDVIDRFWAVSIFQDKLVQHGLDPILTRLCEASLFISMLALHIDNPKKVLGFILIASQILDELESR